MKKASTVIKSIRIRSGVRAGVLIHNHNTTPTKKQAKVTKSIRGRSGVRAGAITHNHNTTRI
jgi:hypothetical protein